MCIKLCVFTHSSFKSDNELYIQGTIYSIIYITIYKVKPRLNKLAAKAAMIFILQACNPDFYIAGLQPYIAES